jgi:hypothetical protein
MTADELDEVIARAMREDDRKVAAGRWNDWDQASQSHRETYRRRARAVRQAISAAGMAVVPKEASEDVLIATILVTTDEPSQTDIDSAAAVVSRLPPTHLSESCAMVAEMARDYRAMVRAGAVGGVDG